MKIICPECRVPVAAEDVNLGTGLAKCRTCNNVFRFTDVAPELAAPAARARIPVEKPRSVVTSEFGGELTLEYRWFSWKYLFLAFFCLFWDGFLVVWYAIAVRSGNPVLMLFPLLHVAVGIGLTYATLAGFVNTTTVRIDAGRIRVRHHPLPWGRTVELGVVEVKQLFCQEKISRGRNGVSYTYDLVALLHDGTRRKVLGGLDYPELPLYLEQNAESWLKIRDEPVVGELAR
ncbi:hypothetical protein [Longimicrobium sp.]|uniref:hypothetical protein n=1 Tax=Longimicrobium sp. TaxID=2029185 RepID=UPI002CE4AD97|nr:hypothetical protein [Longimicrobium sp.]HSU15354.1 hypothetical protein [Longimicrobium sp.]